MKNGSRTFVLSLLIAFTLSIIVASYFYSFNSTFVSAMLIVNSFLLTAILFRPRKNSNQCTINGTTVKQCQLNNEILKESEERYKAFISMSGDGIWRGELSPPVDINWSQEKQTECFVTGVRIVECNDALARIYGYDRAEDMIGLMTRNFYDLDQSQDVRESLEEFVQNGYALAEYETMQYDRDKKPIWLASSLTGIPKTGKIDRVWGIRRDVTEKRRQHELLEYQANHDSLTDLPNRFYLKNTLEKHLEMLDDHGRIALIMLDLDRFKEVNDTLSHHAGDLLLSEFAKRLHPVVSAVGGELARLGGDEFAVIFTRINDEKDAYWLAERMLKSIQAPFEIENIKVEIEASLGIAIAPDHGRTTAQLLRCADIAMYRAKKEMCRYTLYDTKHDPYTPDRLALMNDLARTIRAGQLDLHFQPKINLAEGGLAGFEALVRWYHPEKGLLMPAEFIPFAEIGELIVPLTYQVIEKSIKQLKMWRDAGINTTIACNLSTRLLMDEDLSYHIEAFLESYGVDPIAFELEITETALIAEPERAREILSRISALGVRLSIDDFGTGYSSLALLKSLPINALKIDLLFVSQMQKSEQDAIIVASTINLAHNLGLKVVAEGVENIETLEKLKEIGCDQAQGYFIGVPMSREDVEIWIAGGTFNENGYEVMQVTTTASLN
ncbi:MAG: EAL domain-containing protein [Geobacteraceae bacterium]|nr:EAL domain-containing protein [Geobacteraceae bacterium]